MKPLLSTVQRKHWLYILELMCALNCACVSTKRYAHASLVSSILQRITVVSFLCATALVSCIIKMMPRSLFKSTYTLSVCRVRGAMTDLSHLRYGFRKRFQIKTKYFHNGSYGTESVRFICRCIVRYRPGAYIHALKSSLPLKTMLCCNEQAQFCCT